LTAAERAQVAVVPNARMDSLDPAGTGSTGTGSTTPVGAAHGGQPESGDGTQTGQSKPGSGQSNPGSGQSNPGATAGDGEGDSAVPSSPSLAYIEEDGRTDSITKGPTINGIQVWVHTPSRTLYADSCGVLQTITGRDQEFGPTPEAPGYGAICPQL
jgi:hypothetical protein